MDLKQGLREYSLRSALQDSRFNPITLDEIINLQVGISLLTDFEECLKDDWEIGIHGIWIDFKNSRGKKFSSTFLPEVAMECNWTREETLIQLVRKAGASFNNIQDLKITRYKSLKGKMSYQEYIEYTSRKN